MLAVDISEKRKPFSICLCSNILDRGERMFDTRISNVHTLITSMLFIYQGNGSLHEVYGVVGGGGVCD